MAQIFDNPANETMPVRDIMQYESEIWAAADLLIAAGIKQSKFPEYMMPFFALVMLEGRMRKAIDEMIEEEGVSREDDLEEFIDAFRDKECGYNDFIVTQGKTLADICDNDKTFEQDFRRYLDGFDDDLKRLLGIGRGTAEQKFLNLEGIVAELRAKKILMQTVTKWAEIDLSCYNNSDITTLEEHIKRRWADISAETAGEQYTPQDIISLIAEIVASKITKAKDKYIHIYDPTCGGANLLFGVSDKLQHEAGYPLVATYGCDFNDSLYALSAIESRFRNQSHIRYGNTLTTLPFKDKSFDVIIANPPYGISWKGYESDIRNDQTGQFHACPAVSDGQLLFMQHILWQLDQNGIAVEVHNGSTLFSGDAGGGESNIRKYIFDQDWVEAIIQMPSDEFFNTGIYTYLWIMNKNKSADRRGKVMLINGSNGWKLLKKSKGSKRREMLPEHRQQIVDALTRFEDCEIGKVFAKEHFYYNKVAIKLYQPSKTEKSRSIIDTVCRGGKTLKIVPKEIIIDDGSPLPIHLNKFQGLNREAADNMMELFSRYDYRTNVISIVANDDITYTYNIANASLYTGDLRLRYQEELGHCKITFKMSHSAKTGYSQLTISAEPEIINDYEIIPYSSDQEENQKKIDDFLNMYVFKRHYIKDYTVGVELNFNKEFYVPEEIGSVEDILNNIQQLKEEIENEKDDMQIIITRGLNPNVPLKDSGVDWIGMIPEHWEVRRIKEITKSMKSGGTPSSGNPNFYDENGTPWVSIGDMSSTDVIQDTNKKLTIFGIEDKKLEIIPKGTILYSIYASIGKVSELGIDATINQAILALDFIDGINKRYMKYQLASMEEHAFSVSNGNTQYNLNASIVSNFEVKIPPLSEQRAIADYLDEKCAKIDAAVANIGKQIDALKRLKRALINEVVTGKRKV